MWGGGPKIHIGQDISNQSEMEKCKSCRLQQYEDCVTRRESIDFRNEMSHHQGTGSKVPEFLCVGLRGSLDYYCFFL